MALIRSHTLSLPANHILTVFASLIEFPIGALSLLTWSIDLDGPDVSNVANYSLRPSDLAKQKITVRIGSGTNSP